MEFKVDIPELTKNISDYCANYENTKQILDETFETLSNIDAGWNDSDSKVFVRFGKKDQNKMENFFESFDKLYKEVENFKNQIDATCSEYGYPSVVLTFNNSKFPLCFQFIDSATASLNAALSCLAVAYSYYSTINYDPITGTYYPDYAALAAITRAVNLIAIIKEMIVKLIEILRTFIRKIEKIVSDSEITMAKLSGFEQDIVLHTYKWKTLKPVIDVVEPEAVANVSANDTDIDIENNDTLTLDSVANSTASKTDLNINSFDSTPFSPGEVSSVTSMAQTIGLSEGNLSKVNNSDAKVSEVSVDKKASLNTEFKLNSGVEDVREVSLDKKVSLNAELRPNSDIENIKSVDIARKPSINITNDSSIDFSSSLEIAAGNKAVAKFVDDVLNNK